MRALEAELKEARDVIVCLESELAETKENMMVAKGE